MRTTAERDVWAPFRSLVGGQGVSVILGLLFWVLAARVLPAAEVGVAAAAISTQTLLGLVGSLGVGTHLVTVLPRRVAGRRLLLARSLTVVALAGAVLGAVVVAAAQLAGGALGAAVGDPVRALVLVAGSAVAAVVLVLDEAVLGLRRAPVQLLRNVTASGTRLPLAVVVIAVGARDALTLQLCWVLPLVVSVAVAWWRLRPDLAPSGDAPAPSVRADLALHTGPALRHHTLNLAVAAATQLLPVAAGLTLVATDNAAFAIAWLLATVAYLPPYLLTMSLFAAVANAGPDAFRAAMRHTLLVAVGLSLLATAGAWALGGEVLRVFGGQYADRADTLLALLVPAGLWMVVKDHLVAWWRAERRFALASWLAAGSLALEIGAAAVGGLLGGATGLVLGWLAAMGLELVVAVPVLWRVLHPREQADGRSRPRPLDRRRVLAGGAVAVSALVLALLAWIALPALTELHDGSADPVDRAAPTAVDRDCFTGTVPALDLSVKTDTGDPTRPHLTAREVDRLVGLAADAGASTVSTTLSWRVAQPTRGAPYDVRGLDRVLAAADRHGLDVRVQLVHTPAWAIDRPSTSRPTSRSTSRPTSAWRPPTTSTELRRWSRFVADVVRHLDGRARYLEAWTEPNRVDTWITGPDATAFARLLTVTAAAVRRTDPRVQLISGGLASNDVAYARRLVVALGGARPFDLFGLHPWTLTSPLSGPSWRDGVAEGVDDSFTGFHDVHDVVGTPLYLGEVGYRLGSSGSSGSRRLTDAERAVWATEALDVAACSDDVVGLSWYHLHTTRWDPRAWSLLDGRGRPGATYDALAAWTAAHDQHRRITTRTPR